MKRKKNILIIAIFLLLYLASMIFTTYKIKEQYITKAETLLEQMTHNLRNRFSDDTFETLKDELHTPEQRLSFMKYLASIYYYGVDKHHQISIAIYDENGNLAVQTEDSFGSIRKMHDAKDYFSEDDYKEIIELFKKTDINDVKTALYSVAYYEPESSEPVAIEVIQLGTTTPLWCWINPNKDSIDYKTCELKQTGYLYFPYLAYGEDVWNQWKADEWLQEFPDTDLDRMIPLSEYNDLYADKNAIKEQENYAEIRLPFEWNYDCFTEDTNEDLPGKIHAIVLRHRIYPWKAAMEEMTSIYLFGFVIVLICSAIVIFISDRFYKKQMLLEQSRRDFTNAAAHELKTPLAIVRGLAETMEETPSEEKKAAYRAEIVNQTEVMDHLVKEMIFISKLDSEQLTLRKEPLSILTLIEEQIDKLQHLLDEKNIQVQYWKNNDFIVIGDKAYIEKALFSLIENAISYNRIDGKISIHVEKNSCTIENTASPISEEDLPHVFNMFFTSNKSRNKDVNHKGLGLYLAKKIFNLHELDIKIENTDIGVKVTVYK